MVGLKKRIEELRLELEAENFEREEAKQFKETIEQELKGYEVELALNNTAFQALEVCFIYFSFDCFFITFWLNNSFLLNQLQSRISLIHNEISTVGAEVEALKVLIYACLVSCNYVIKRLFCVLMLLIFFSLFCWTWVDALLCLDLRRKNKKVYGICSCYRIRVFSSSKHWNSHDWLCFPFMFLCRDGFIVQMFELNDKIRLVSFFRSW